MDAPPTGLPLSEPRRLNTPTRETLLNRFHASESRSLLWLGVEVLVIAGGSAWWFLQPHTIPDWQLVLLFAVGFLGLFDFIVTQLFANRKRLEDIRPDAKFGQHTRDSLLAAVRRVQMKLDVTERDIRVYLARDKEVNALAMRLELLPGWRLFNGVQLNRSILHLLDTSELESVIGHEIGHLFAYSPITSRCMLIHGLLSGVLTLVIAQLLSAYEVSLGAPLLAIGAVRWSVFSVGMAQIRLVEFLCDDHGARAAGITPAITAELKIGLEQEARSTLMMRVLQAKQQHANLRIADLMDDYEAALPWGSVDTVEARKQLERGIQRRVEEGDSTSLMGFYQFLFKSDDTDHSALEESIAELLAVRSIAKIPVSLSDVLSHPHRLAECMHLIEANPDQVLLHLEEEVNDRGTTHPCTSRRILYLWRNREAIADAG